jgi:hypothetical protein
LPFSFATVSEREREGRERGADFSALDNQWEEEDEEDEA